MTRYTESKYCKRETILQKCILLFTIYYHDDFRILQLGVANVASTSQVRAASMFVLIIVGK